MAYYALWYRLESQDRYLIWATDPDSDAKDVVLVDADAYILTFDDLSCVYEYAADNNLIVKCDQPTLHDLDWAAMWVRGPSEAVNCVHALNAWNLFLDVWQSVKRHRDAFRSIAERNRTVYDKLFFGNNLPAMTPEGEKYIPEWSQQEITVLRSVLLSGLEMLGNNLVVTKDE